MRQGEWCSNCKTYVKAWETNHVCAKPIAFDKPLPTCDVKGSPFHGCICGKVIVGDKNLCGAKAGSW